MKKFRLAIFASGSGSNAEAICDYFREHKEIEVVLILSNNPQAGVLERAKSFFIDTAIFNKADFQENGLVQHLLKEKAVTHVILAGFLWLIPKFLIQEFPDKIVNIHPALLPKYGGKGMYGMRVHEAVKQSGDSLSGITIHVVNENFDEGEHLQQITCRIEPQDSPIEIANKIQLLEHQHYPKAVEQWIIPGSV